MDNALSERDIGQLYLHSILLYKDELVYVSSQNGQLLTLYVYRTRKKITIPFVKEHFNSPKNRIGMINIGKSVFFIERSTHRQYSIGFTEENLHVKTLPVPYPAGLSRTKECLNELTAAAYYQSYSNDYPPLAPAYEKAKEYNGACAFDKQFAVDKDGIIFYKNFMVGSYINGIIAFIPGYEHYSLLLENSYEKTSRTFKATPIRR